ncbi:hypothetical protein BKA57DRAFT_129548 [Linnemannia elongata]|nr:hypothetical protein BKA57DRAFT_129548 [Linnemannia elongata]
MKGKKTRKKKESRRGGGKAGRMLFLSVGRLETPRQGMSTGTAPDTTARQKNKLPKNPCFVVFSLCLSLSLSLSLFLSLFLLFSFFFFFFSFLPLFPHSLNLPSLLLLPPLSLLLGPASVSGSLPPSLTDSSSVPFSLNRTFLFTFLLSFHPLCFSPPCPPSFFTLLSSTSSPHSLISRLLS